MNNANDRSSWEAFPRFLYTASSDTSIDNSEPLVQSAMLFDAVNGQPVPFAGSGGSRITANDRASMREVFTSQSEDLKSVREKTMQFMALSDLVKDKVLKAELSEEELQWLELSYDQLQSVFDGRGSFDEFSAIVELMIEPPTIRLQYHYEQTLKCLDFETRIQIDGGVLVNDPREITLACKLYQSLSKNSDIARVADKILDFYEVRDKLSMKVKRKNIDLANAKRARNYEKYNALMEERQRLAVQIDQVSVDSAPFINEFWKFRDCRYYISERHNYGNGDPKIRTPNLKTASEIMDWHLKRNDVKFIEPEDVEKLDERITALEERLDTSLMIDKDSRQASISRFRQNLNEVTQDYFNDYAAINTSIIWQYSNSERFMELVSDFNRIEEQTDNAINRSSRPGKSHKKGKKGKKSHRGRNQSKPGQVQALDIKKEKAVTDKIEAPKQRITPLESAAVAIKPRIEHSQKELEEAKIADLTGAFSKNWRGGEGRSQVRQEASSAQSWKMLKPSSDIPKRTFSELVDQEWIGSTYGTGQNSLDKHFDKHVKKSVKKEHYFSMSRLFSYIEAANSNNEIRKFRDGNYAFVLKGTVFEAFGGHFSKTDTDERHTYTFYKRGSEKIDSVDVEQFKSELLSYLTIQPSIAESIMTSSLRQCYDLLFQS